MKVQLKPAGTDQTIEVNLARADQTGASESFRATVGESVADVVIESSAADPTAGRLKQHGTVAAFHTLRRDKNIDVWLDGRVYTFEIVDATARRSTEKTRSSGSFEALTAPMPGTILKINVQRGDAFEAHSPLVVMESMKMEMTLSAPAAGRVKEIACRVGQLVEMGQLLARMESADAV